MSRDSRTSCRGFCGCNAGILYLSWFAIAVIGTVGCSHLRPSNQRDWIQEHAVLPRVRLHDGIAEICNLRDFQHCSKDKSIPNYRHASIDLCQISTVDLFICYPRSESSPFAHTMLSFGTSGGDEYYVISVEARREKGERYGVVTGMLNKFELIYVIATEQDVLDLRANMRDEQLYRYPIVVKPQHARSLFADMLQQVHELESTPQFYDTLKNNCTSNLLKHAEEIGSRDYPDRMISSMPGYSDRILHRIGLIDDRVPFQQLRRCAKVNEPTKHYRCDPDFSRKIRHPHRLDQDNGKAAFVTR